MTNEKLALLILGMIVVSATVLVSLSKLDSTLYVAIVSGMVGGVLQRYLGGVAKPSDLGGGGVAGGVTPASAPSASAASASALVGTAGGMLIGGLGGAALHQLF